MIRLLTNKYVIGVLLLIIIAVLVKLLLAERGNRINAETARDAANKDYMELNVKYRGVQGDLITKTRTIQLNERNFHKALEANELKWVKKFNAKKKEVEGVISFVSEFETDSIRYDTVRLPCEDTFEVFLYNYQDEYNTITAMVTEVPILEIRDRLYLVETNDRPKGWFWKLQWGRRERHLSVTNSNKLVTIDSVVVVKKTF